MHVSKHNDVSGSNRALLPSVSFLLTFDSDFWNVTKPSVSSVDVFVLEISFSLCEVFQTVKRERTYICVNYTNWLGRKRMTAGHGVVPR